MSKKLAAGIDGLVLDVKTGSGAFMKKLSAARRLASRMVEIGAACGKRVRALLTDMSQPLGHAVGNALEVIEAIETLKGHGPRDLVEVSRELTAEMFLLGGVEKSLAKARGKFDALLAGGKPLERFAQVIREQGGDPRVVEDASRLPAAAHEDSLVAPEEGYVAALDAEAMGRASMLLGAGRERIDSTVDPAAGMVFEKKVGDRVSAGERICALYTNDPARLERARGLIRSAIKISGKPVPEKTLVLGRVGEEEKAKRAVLRPRALRRQS